MPSFDSLFTSRLSAAIITASLLLQVASASSTEPALEKFQKEIQPILDDHCYDCHGNGTAKGGVTLDEVDNATLHDPKLWFRALKNIRAGLMPPADKPPLAPAEAEKLLQWIKRDAFGLDPAEPDPGRVTVRRLNRVEYRNTIHDLLGVDFDTIKEFPTDDAGLGFDNIADVLTISPMLLERYLDAAQTVVTKGVPLEARTVAGNSIRGREFAVLRMDPAKPPEPVRSAASPVLAAEVSPRPAVSAPSVDGGAASATAAAAPEAGVEHLTNGAAPADLSAQRPPPAVDGDGLTMSYYTPVVVGTKYHVEHDGKYQFLVDLLATETFVDNLFDLNRCRLTFAADGKVLFEREFLRENDKKFSFTFEHDWTAGDHDLTFEVTPLDATKPAIRRLRLRLKEVTVRGPLAREQWVKTKDYEKFFPRLPPTEPKERRAYARTLLTDFATRAFRRPPDAATVDPIVDLAESIYAQPQNTFETGVAQAMVSILASPHFIFREESTEPPKPGQAFPLVDEYSLASRLSYFFWSSTPDEELMNLAATGRVRATLPAQIKRLLSDSRAQQFVSNFTGQWLQARDIATVPITTPAVFLRDHPDPAVDAARATFARLQAKPQAQRTPEEQTEFRNARRVFASFNRAPKPRLSDSLRKSMQQETEAVFAYIFQEDRSVLELLESDYTFLNQELAEHYGIAGVTGPELRRVVLPAGSPRGGVLTQGTVLTVTSNPTRTSPVKRGLFILGSILGTPPAPPPPNIPALEDAASPEALKKMTLRETLALHAEKASCRSCHSRMDPPGLALENFNAMGHWRDSEFNNPIEPAGNLVTGESFHDVRELKHILATARRGDFYYCLSEKLLTYALGRGLEYYDVDTVDQLVAQLESTGGRPSALINAIVISAPFQQRRPSLQSIAAAVHSSVPAAP